MSLAKSATLAVGVGVTGTAEAGNRGLGAEASGTVGAGGAMYAYHCTTRIISCENTPCECRE